MQYHNFAAALTKDEVKAIKAWCASNDTTMSKLITEYLRKVLTKGENDEKSLGI